MKTLLVAIHGIMTNQTNASWPDRLDAWMFAYRPEIKVIKKEYRAGPFPRWNCYVKDPRLATSLANELELFLHPSLVTRHSSPSLWFVAHSNGAVIALLTAQILARRGYKIAGLILTGAACQADIAKNGVLELIGRGALDSIIAYCSHDDAVLAGDPAHDSRSDAPRSNPLTSLKQRLWRKLTAPYGCLGRTGWLMDGKPCFRLTRSTLSRAITRWYPGGHSTYFTPWNIRNTFTQILYDITSYAPVATPNASLRRN